MTEKTRYSISTDVRYEPLSLINIPAIVDSGISRLRPVAMAALTTALGMIPLLPDAFFVSMAVTIIAGLLFATVLTMVVVPVLYAIFFRVPSEPPPTSLP